MVFPRPGGPCLCGHSSSSSRCHPSVAWGFLAGSRLFEGPAAPAAAAAASSQHRETYSKVSRRFQKGRSVPETSISDSIRPSGPWCFPVQEGRVFVGTAAAVAVSCFGSCLIAAAQQQHHSSSSSHQQQHQQQAAAGSRQPQAAAGSSRQQQASVGSSRHKQTQQ